MSSSSLQRPLHVQLTFPPWFAIMTAYFPRANSSYFCHPFHTPTQSQTLYPVLDRHIPHDIPHNSSSNTKRTLLLFTNSHECHDAITDGKFHKHVTCYSMIIQPSLINIWECFNIISAGESQSNHGCVAQTACISPQMRTQGCSNTQLNAVWTSCKALLTSVSYSKVSERRLSILTKAFVALLAHPGKCDLYQTWPWKLPSTSFRNSPFTYHPTVRRYRTTGWGEGRLCLFTPRRHSNGKLKYSCTHC